MIASRTLALFPLHVVLFPGATMPLHIFEPRYRQMVAHCLEGDRRFGLVYHDPDRQGPFLGEEGRVGCMANIARFQPLPDGRSLIVAEGEERFRVTGEMEVAEMYYAAEVAPLDPGGDPAPATPARRDASLALFRAAVARLSERGETPPLPEIDLERDASFQLAQVIRIDPAWQQQLLEIPGETARLDHLDEMLRRVIGEEEGR
jgi:Lon protease-like protein